MTPRHRNASPPAEGSAGGIRHARTWVAAAPSLAYAGSAVDGFTLALPSGGSFMLTAADCTRLLAHRQRQRLRIAPPQRAPARRALGARPAVTVPQLPVDDWAEAVNLPFRRSLSRLRPHATDEESCCLAAVLHAEGVFARPLEPITARVLAFLESLVGRRAILESRQLRGLIAITGLTLRSRDAEDWLVVDLLALGKPRGVAHGDAPEPALRLDHVRVPDLCVLHGGTATSRHGTWALHMDPARVARWNPLTPTCRRGSCGRRGT
jgi:hypothetical protein